MTVPSLNADSDSRCAATVEALLLLVLLTAVAYWPVLRFEFVDWDDPLYVTENPHVQEGLTPAGVAYAWTTLHKGNWIPLTWLSLELDVTLFGLDPAAFHAVNLLWHVANTCLVYLALRGMTGADWASFAVAALFAVHPLHVESVAWIAERKDVLSTFWLLLALLLYTRYVRRPSGWRMTATAVAMLLGLLSKSMVVTLPVLLLLLDFWPFRRWVRFQPSNRFASSPQASLSCLVFEKWPLFGLSLLVGVMTIAAQRSTGAVVAANELPWIYRIGNAVHACGWYLLKTIWPTNLCAYYPHPGLDLPWGEVGLSAVALIGISSWAWCGRIDQPHRLTGWLWFLVALAPVIGLLQVGGQAHADRYTYVPHIGLFWMIVWEVRRFAAADPATDGRDRVVRPEFSRRRRAMVVLTAGVVIACMLATRNTLAMWRNSDTLWAQALRVDAENPIAHFQLGRKDWMSGRLEQALEHFERVVLRQPRDSEAVEVLARIHVEREDWDAAIAHYEWLLRIDPDQPQAAVQLATLRRQHVNGESAVRGTPPPSEAAERLRTGLVEARAGRVEAALEHFLEALRIDPGSADAWNNAGLACRELGRADEARTHFAKAVNLAPGQPDFQFNLAVLLEAQGEMSAARELYAAVLRLRPSDPEARLRLEALKQR